jgi:regulator of nucleoside diphosphate kinase
MNTKNIHISENDLTRIRLLIGALQGDPRGAKLTARLRDEIERATVVAELPPKVIGIRSTAEVLDLESGEVDRFMLTLPEQADAAQGRLSIFAPLGTAILGFSEGDEFEWEMPGGVRRLRIQKVTQEAPVPVTANS